MSAGIVIPVDGPAGSGKSTAAKGVAERLGWDYLETGALYRAVGLLVLERGGDPDDPEAAALCAREMRFECRRTPDGWRNFLEGRDATQALREERVSDAASRVSAIPEVRQALLGFQRAYKGRRGAVMDGRDIGTVVFPDAGLKVFLVATAAERAHRRLLQEGREPHAEAVRAEAAALSARDALDRERSMAPLREAADAVRLDTTGMAFPDQVEAVVALARRAFPPVDTGEGHR